MNNDIKHLGNIIVEMQSGSSTHVRRGWANTLNSIGYRCYEYHCDRNESINDLFNKIGKVDIFLGTTYNLNRSLVNQIKSRPEMKVALYCSGFGSFCDTLNRKEYPLDVASDEEKRLVEAVKDRISCVHIHCTESWVKDYIGGWTNELGIPAISVMNGADLFTYSKACLKEKYRCGIGFVGGNWNYKSINLNKTLIRLCREEWHNYNIKIWGNGWDVPQHLGLLADGEDAHMFASSKICPNISEPHSTNENMGFDIIERVFKVPVSNGFLISDKVNGLKDIFLNNECPTFTSYEEFKELIDFYLKPENFLKKTHLQNTQKKTIWAKHTYFERMSKLLNQIGLTKESSLLINKKEELFKFTVN